MPAGDAHGAAGREAHSVPDWCAETKGCRVEMRVLLSTIGSRGEVQLGLGLGLAVRLREAGTMRWCAPPDFAELADSLGVRYLPVGPCCVGRRSSNAGGRPHVRATAPDDRGPGRRQVRGTWASRGQLRRDRGRRWAEDARRWNELGVRPSMPSARPAIGLAPVTDVRSHIFTDASWLAADPTLAPWPGPTELAVFQTSAWILPDERPCP